MADDPEVTIAEKLLTQILTGLGEKVEAEAFKELFGLGLKVLGLGDTDDTDAYLQQIEAQLGALQAQAVQIQDSLDTIDAVLGTIQLSIQDVTLQSVLQAYNGAKNIVLSNYSSYVLAVQDVLSGDAAKTKPGADALFHLQQTNNINQIDTALLDIHDYVYGTGETTGIIDLQHVICQQALQAWGQQFQSTPAIRQKYTVEHEIWWYSDPFSRYFPNFVDNSVFYKDGLNVPMSEALANSIIPLLQSIVGVEMRAIMLLTTAWSGTSQSTRLTQHFQNLQRQFTKLNGLYAMLVNGADTWAVQMLTQYGTPLDSYVTDHWRHKPYPYDVKTKTIESIEILDTDTSMSFTKEGVGWPEAFVTGANSDVVQTLLLQLPDSYDGTATLMLLIGMRKEAWHGDISYYEVWGIPIDNPSDLATKAVKLKPAASFVNLTTTPAQWAAMFPATVYSPT